MTPAITRAVVTGGSGFIGTNLVAALRKRGVPVLNLDVASPRNPEQRDTWRQVDLLDLTALRDAMREFEPNVLFHLGARTDLAGRTVGDYGANVQGVQNMVAAAAEAGTLERSIYASSRLVCEIGYQPKAEDDYRATTPYGQSKVEGELIVRREQPAGSWVIVRPTSIWGPWFDVPYKHFFQAVARNRYVHPRGADPAKSYGFVGNTVHELLSLAETDELHGRTIYLADYPPLRLREFARLIQRAIGSRPIREVPEPLLRSAAAAGDALQRIGWKEPPLTSFRLDNLLTEMPHDVEPLRQVAGELPYDLPEGVARTVEWMRAHGEI